MRRLSAAKSRQLNAGSGTQYAIGMRRAQVMRYVVLPQAIKRVIPPFMNQSIIQLRIPRFCRRSQSPICSIRARSSRLRITARSRSTRWSRVIYFIVLFSLTLAAQQIERRLARSD
jgi:polar amino acid transport system permease protein